MGRASLYVATALMLSTPITVVAQQGQATPQNDQISSEDLEPRTIGSSGTTLVGIAGYVDKFSSSEDTFPGAYTVHVDVTRFVTDRLKEAGLSFTRADAYVTPRRLALVVDGLPAQQPDTREERKGPRVGAPEQAIQGFLKSAGLASLDQAEVQEIKGARFHVAVIEKKGGRTAAILPALLDGAIG